MEKPILLVKLGDKERGWIPSKEHFDDFIEKAVEAGLYDKFNIILYHYALDIQLLDSNKKLEDYGLQIIDENKFKEFTENFQKERETQILMTV